MQPICMEIKFDKGWGNSKYRKKSKLKAVNFFKILIFSRK